MQQMSASRTTTKCAPKLKNSTLQPSGGTTIRLRFCSRRSRREHFVFSNTRSGPEPIFHRPNRNRFSMYSITSRISRRRRPTSFQWTSTTIPSPEMLRDHARREEACATVVKLCQYGGHWVQSRKRPSGKRSWSWRPYIRAPKPQRHFPKREAERTFIMLIRIAWQEATSTEAPLTADPRRPGPFARMVKECLKLVGAAHADAVGLINELNQVRRAMRSRPEASPVT